MKSRLALSSLLILCLAGSSFALVTNLVATIDEGQANAGGGTGSLGAGSATMTYDDGSGVFAWNISWAGLSGNPTLMHFHGPAPAGINSGVQVDIGAISGLVSPSIGQAVITPAQASDLLDGLWYINIHTALWPGGEIRGQVTVDDNIATDGASWSGVKALFR